MWPTRRRYMVDFFFFLSTFNHQGTRLTLTADSVKNSSVKLSIKFMMLKIQSKDRRFKIQEANQAICSQAFSLQRQVQHNPSG